MAMQLHTDCCWNICESGHSVTAVSHPHTRAAFLHRGSCLPSWLTRGEEDRGEPNSGCFLAQERVGCVRVQLCDLESCRR